MKRRIVLWAGLLIIVLMTIIPPWYDTTSYQNSSGMLEVSRRVRYSFISRESIKKIRYRRLFLQYAIISVGMLAAIIALTRKRSKTKVRFKQRALELISLAEQRRRKAARLQQSHQEYQKCRDDLGDQITAEVTATSKKPQYPITEHRPTKKHVKQEAADLITANKGMSKQPERLHEGIRRVEKPKDTMGPLDPEELERLARLARRLTGDKNSKESIE